MAEPSHKAGSENTVGRLYDRCLADTIVKIGIGFSVGVVSSVLLFKRRQWPIMLSTGFGAGYAMNNCDRLFNPARIPGTRILHQDQPVPQKSVQ
ncbi:hypothetical protein FRB94_000437 [Tulasnella sp. JGI-2019a]|nr:hypothetical protein FRB94_000437 [Tulasnella sp. JGI-2019a]KAG8999388.1 hypothetical protein FRB93_013267 [Tulasnella sp. JGI-2019a]